VRRAHCRKVLGVSAPPLGDGQFLCKWIREGFLWTTHHYVKKELTVDIIIMIAPVVMFYFVKLAGIEKPEGLLRLRAADSVRDVRHSRLC